MAELGDQVEKALEMVGIDKERFSKWIGQPCGCEERKERLNQASRWARRYLSGKVDQAKTFIERLMGG